MTIKQRILQLGSSLILGWVSLSANAVEEWFETFKQQATPEQLYQFLYALPKGADLHNHLTDMIELCN